MEKYDSYSSLVNHGLESFEVVESGSFDSQGDLLGNGGLIPLLAQIELLDGFNQVSSSDISHDGDSEFSQGKSFNRDDLSINTSGGTFNEDLFSVKKLRFYYYSVFIEDIQDDSKLSSLGTEVDIYDSSDFNEILVGLEMLEYYEGNFTICLYLIDL